MATDLKIEIFAFKLFHKFWHDVREIENEPDVFEIYGDECTRDNSYLEACDNLILEGFYNRSELVSNIYLASFKRDGINNFTSLSEVYDYISAQCDREDLFGNLTVCERVLATTDFATSICFYLYTKEKPFKDVLKYGHIFWALYFDKFTEEFYKEGGWKKLKLVAKSYVFLHNLITVFSLKETPIRLHSLKEAAINYRNYKKAFKYYERKKPKNKIRISILWVKFRIQYFNSYISVPLTYEAYADAQEVHILLDDFRLLSNPSYHIIYWGETIQGSCEESFLSGNANTFDHGLRICDSICDEFSNRLDFEKQFKNENWISSTEVIGFDIAEKVENIQFDKKILTEIEMPQYNTPGVEPIEYSSKKDNLSLDLIMYRRIEGNRKLPKIIKDNCTNKNEENEIEEFYSRNVEGRSEIEIPDELFSTNQKGESEYIREITPRNLCNKSDIGSAKECSNSENEMINTKEKLEANFYSKKEERQSKNAKTSNASKCDGESSDILPKLNQFNQFNRCVDKGDEIEIIQKAREDLRNEQNEPDIMIFLRLLLVLGDKKEVKSVLTALPSNEGSSLNIQEKSNKKKIQKKKSIK